MYDVTQTFIENSRKQGRQIDVLLSWNGNIPSGDDVLKIDKTFDGDFYRTIMQQVEGEIVGRHDLTNQIISIQVGISHDNSPYEYIDWGEFIVKEHERIVGPSPEFDRTTFKAYDKLLLAHTLYDVNELGITYPISVFALYEAIATYLGLEISETSIINGGKIISEDKWTNIENITYRNILDEISAVSGSSIMMNGGKLLAKRVDPADNPLDTIDENNVKTIKIGDMLKPINILNLTREQAHDNYVIPFDWENIPINDRSEIVVADNQIMDKDREVYAPDLLSAIEGLSYYTFETSGYGLYHIQPLDVVSVIDMSGNEHISVITSGRMVPTVGNVEELKSAIPGMTREKYALVTDNRRNFMRVNFLVDQQNGMIQGLVEKTDRLDDGLVETQTSLTLLDKEIKLDVSEIRTELENTEIGGSNLLINGSGELKDFTYWTFYPTNARLMFHKSLLYRKALTNYTIFDIVTNENSLSGNNLSFFANGKALNGLFRTYPDNEYGFRFKRVSGSQGFNIEIHEFNENKGYIGKRVYTFDNTEVYGTISNITFDSETSFFALLYDVQASFSNRLVLTELMLNVGNPKTYEKNPDVIEESIRIEVLNRITRVETETTAQITANTEAITLERSERTTEYGTISDSVRENSRLISLNTEGIETLVEETITDIQGQINKSNLRIDSVDKSIQTFSNQITDLEGDMVEQQTFFRTGMDGLTIGGTDWVTVMHANGERISFQSQTGSIQAQFGVGGMYVNRWETDFHAIEKFEEGSTKGTIHKNRKGGS